MTQLVAGRDVVDPEHRPSGTGPAADDGDVVLGRGLLLDPGLEREAGLVEGAEGAEVDGGVCAVEVERAAEPSGGPGRAADHSRVPVPRRVRQRRPRPLIEPVRRHDPGRVGPGGSRHRKGGKTKNQGQNETYLGPVSRHVA